MAGLRRLLRLDLGRLLLESGRPSQSSAELRRIAPNCARLSLRTPSFATSSIASRSSACSTCRRDGGGGGGCGGRGGGGGGGGGVVVVARAQALRWRSSGRPSPAAAIARERATTADAIDALGAPPSPSAETSPPPPSPSPETPPSTRRARPQEPHPHHRDGERDRRRHARPPVPRQSHHPLVPHAFARSSRLSHARRLPVVAATPPAARAQPLISVKFRESFDASAHASGVSFERMIPDLLRLNDPSSTDAARARFARAPQ